MHIVQCIVSKSGQFKNKLLEFSSKVNILSGPNDSGKTYLSKAICDTLWGCHGDYNCLSEDSWQDLYLNVTTSFNGKNIQFQRNGNANLAIIMENSKSNNHSAKSSTDVANILSVDNLTSIKNPDVVRSSVKEKVKDSGLENYFLWVNVEIFETLSIINSLVDSRENNFNIDILKNYLIKDYSTYDGIFHNLNNFFSSEGDEQKFNQSLNSKILFYEGEIKKYEKEIKIIELQNSKKHKLKEEREKTINEINHYNKELEAFKVKHENIIEIKKMLKNLEFHNFEIDKINQQLDAKKDKQNEIKLLEEKINTNYPQFKEFTEVQKNNLDKIQDFYSKIKTIDDNIDKLNIKECKRKFTFKRNFVALSLGLVAGLFTVAEILHHTLKFSDKKVIYITLGVLYFALNGLSFISFFMKNNHSKIVEEKDLRENLKKQLGIILEENNINFFHSNVDETYEFLVHYFEDYGSYSEHKKELMGIKETIMDNPYFEKLNENLSSIEKKQEKLLADIKKLSDELELDITPEEVRENSELDSFIDKHLNDVENSRKEVKHNIDINQDLLYKIETELSILSDQSFQTDEINKKIEKLKEQKSKLDNFRGSLGFIHQIMDRAVSQRTSQQMSKLESCTLKVFNNLTDNRYVTDTLDLEKILTSREDFFKKPAVYHIFILSLKIALSDFMVENDIILPLIIDEPTIYMDTKRLDVFKDIISKISENRQVIILTHSNLLNDFGQVVEL